MVAGSLCIASAILLVGYNSWESSQAEKSASDILAKVEGQTPERVADTTDSTQAMDAAMDAATAEMPTITVDGRIYIGSLEIPELEVKLPILTEWDVKLAKKAPCRYKGSAYDGSLIIAGHSYKSHFGRISSLPLGSSVVFTDVRGSVFNYTVADIEVIDQYGFEEMESGDWDLTVFSCTPDGKKRYALRCVIS